MKNTQDKIGNWNIKVPEKVLKIGLVADDYKRDILPKIWAQSEKELKKRMPTFKASDFFHEENEDIPSRKIIMSFRYYTPADNRELEA